MLPHPKCQERESCQGNDLAQTETKTECKDRKACLSKCMGSVDLNIRTTKK